MFPETHALAASVSYGMEAENSLRAREPEVADWLSSLGR